MGIFQRGRGSHAIALVVAAKHFGLESTPCGGVNATRGVASSRLGDTVTAVGVNSEPQLTVENDDRRCPDSQSLVDELQFHEPGSWR